MQMRQTIFLLSPIEQMLKKQTVYILMTGYQPNFQELFKLVICHEDRFQGIIERKVHMYFSFRTDMFQQLKNVRFHLLQTSLNINRKKCPYTCITFLNELPNALKQIGHLNNKKNGLLIKLESYTLNDFLENLY